MTKHLRYILFFAGLVLISLNSVLAQKPDEKVYLFTDRDVYLSGEEIVFSAKIFDENPNLAGLSKTLYIELFKDNISIVKTKYHIDNQLVNGVFRIPDDIKSANYYLRAYTLYQRNFSPLFFANKSIAIINPDRKIDEYFGDFRKPINYRIELLPDGEALLNIVFNNNFLNDLSDLKLLQEKEIVSDSIEIFDNGLAGTKFNFINSKDYYLKMKFKNGDSLNYKLEINDEKFNFYLDENNLIYFDNSNPNYEEYSLKLFNKSFELVKEYKLENQKSGFRIKDNFLSPGLNYLVSYKGDKIEKVKPVFIPVVKTNEVLININKSIFHNREKVKFQSSGLDDGDFYFITVKRIPASKHPETLLQRKYITNPALIIIDSLSINNPSTFNQLNMSLMLNQNWFNTEEFKSYFSLESANKYLPEFRDLTISGKLINTDSKEALAGKEIFASVLGETPQLHSILTNDLGEFIFSLNNLNGIQDVALSTDSIDGINPQIIVNSDFCTRFPDFPDSPIEFDSSWIDYLQAIRRNKSVNYAFAHQILNEEFVRDTIPYPFQQLAASIKPDDFIALPTMQEMFNEIVTYVSARKQKGHFVLHVLNDKKEEIYKNPLVLLDNLAVFNIDELMKINPALINKIDVITTPFTLADATFNGVIIISTKNADFAGMKLGNSTVFLKYITAENQIIRLYPDFENNSNQLNFPYFTTTIFNKSALYNTNDSSINFYSSDEDGIFEIDVKVVKEDGSLNVGKKTISVK